MSREDDMAFSKFCIIRLRFGELLTHCLLDCILGVSRDHRCLHGVGDVRIGPFDETGVDVGHIAALLSSVQTYVYIIVCKGS